MDVLELQLAHSKGSSATQKAKTHVLRLLQTIEEAHKKIEKVAATKEDLETFLDKCISASTKPKLFRDIAGISQQVEEARGLLLEAKIAEEKRQERAAKREAAKKTSDVKETAVNTGGITVHVAIHQGGMQVATNATNPTKAVKATKAYHKKPIPKSVRTHVWNRYIGTEKGESPCYCCGINRIDKAAFEAGHVVPEVAGGPSTVENLRPICGECNRSMKDTNMKDFAWKHYGRYV